MKRSKYFSLQCQKWQCSKIRESRSPYTSPTTGRQLDTPYLVIFLAAGQSPPCKPLQTPWPPGESKPAQMWLIPSREHWCYQTQSQSLGIVMKFCVNSIIYSNADQGKHQSSAPLAFVRGIHRWPVNSPHKGPVTWKTFPFDDVIMTRKTMIYLCPNLHVGLGNIH